MSSWLKYMLLAGCVAAAGNSLADSARYGYGSTPTEAEIKAWDIDVGPDGKGLPAGHGTATQGEETYLQYCSACHGEFGEGVGRYPSLIGGENSLDQDRPRKTVGSFWPYAPILWDYINRSMPFGNAQSLEPDQVYAIVAYILNMNDLIEADTVMDQHSLPRVKMPNRNGFIPDPRPDVRSKACMNNCKDKIEITSSTTNLP